MIYWASSSLRIFRSARLIYHGFIEGDLTGESARHTLANLGRRKLDGNPHVESGSAMKVVIALATFDKFREISQTGVHLAKVAEVLVETLLEANVKAWGAAGDSF